MQVTVDDVRAGKVKPVFFHFRRSTPKGHKSRYEPRGGVTVCFRPILIACEPGVAFRVGVAVCSPLDLYCKERGRRLSLARTNDPSSRLYTILQDPVFVASQVATERWLERSDAHTLKYDRALSWIRANDPRLTTHLGWSSIELAKRRGKKA